MKKIISLFLLLLLAVPFASFATSADSPDASAEQKLEIPAEPVPVDTMTMYIYYGSTAPSGIKSTDDNNGLSVDAAKATWGKLLPDMQYTGGTVVIPGKGYIGVNFTFPKNDAPIVVTSYDKKSDTNYYLTEGNSLELAPENEGEPYINGKQYGMFMIYSSCTLTVAGDYIFDNIALIERTETDAATKTYKHSGTSNIKVSSTGRLVINETCPILKMTDAPESIYLTVEKGGIAYLHSVGFEQYIGEGTIVMDKALYESDKVTDAMFDRFTGAVVDVDGTVLRAATVEPDVTDPVDTDPVGTDPVDTKKPANTSKPKDTQKADTTTAAPATTAAPVADDAGVNPVIFIVAGVAVVAAVVVVVIIVTKKKKTE